MREILFRGKRIDNGEWVEGMLVQHHEEIKASIVLNHFGVTEEVDFICVDPSTVGQYTGLQDKNGKRIFEGDIIQIRFEGDAEPPSTPPVWYETGKVIWHEQLHGWYVVFDDPDGVAIQEYRDGDDVFVIGNIHDNPELLQEVHGEEN